MGWRGSVEAGRAWKRGVRGKGAACVAAGAGVGVRSWQRNALLHRDDDPFLLAV